MILFIKTKEIKQVEIKQVNKTLIFADDRTFENEVKKSFVSLIDLKEKTRKVKDIIIPIKHSCVF